MGSRLESGPRRDRASCPWPGNSAPEWCGQIRSTGSTRDHPSAVTRSRASAAKVAGTGWGPTLPSRTTGDRLRVRKTYKLYIGGAFPRSESGRSYPVASPDGELLAHAAQASRKDVRDAVVAARKAFPGWSGATAYNRGQVLYRIAEMLDGRREQFAAEVRAAEGGSAAAAVATVEHAIDRWVWYAGWADKYAQVTGSANPVAGPYFNFSLPEPTGVVGALAPQESSLLGLVSVIAPIITTGNTTVIVASRARPLPAVSLTGFPAELAPGLASHRDVNAIDLTGVDPADRPALQRAAADNVKRVFAPADEDWQPDPGTARLAAFVETKTVWHPVGV